MYIQYCHIPNPVKYMLTHESQVHDGFDGETLQKGIHYSNI